MNDILSLLASAAERGEPFGNDAACCCEGRTVEVLVKQRVPIGEDGDAFEVEVPAVRCLECGLAFTDERAEKVRHAAACLHQGLLTPDEVQELRRSLGMSRKAFADAFKVPQASMERWENGRLFQNGSMDTLLRALMLPGVARALDRRPRLEPRPQANNVIPFPTLAERSVAEKEAISQRQATFRLRA